MFLNDLLVLDNEYDDDNDDDISIPTADCWIVRQSSVVIVAYDQFNAVNQQVGFNNKKK